jgi:anti-sigma-K factor RskA
MSEEAEAMDRRACGANAAPYVLGALAEDEHEAFREHMASCTICREEVAALQTVAASLPAAAPQLTAPSDLKRRVMSAVHEDSRRLPTVETRPVRRRAPLVRFGWRPAFGALTAAAAVVLAVVLISSGGGAGTRVIRAEALVPRATAVLRIGAGHAELSISGMPQAPSGRIYQVWLKGSGGPQATDALFTVSSRGDATVGVPGVVAGIREVMVTAEPLGGSRAPTSPPLIIARLS